MTLNISFGHIPSFDSRDSAGKQNFGQNWTFRSATVTLKIRSMSPEPHQLSLPSPNNVSVQVWSKSTHWFRRYGVEKADFLQSFFLISW